MEPLTRLKELVNQSRLTPYHNNRCKNNWQSKLKAVIRDSSLTSINQWSFFQIRMEYRNYAKCQMSRQRGPVPQQKQLKRKRSASTSQSNLIRCRARSKRLTQIRQWAMNLTMTWWAPDKVRHFHHKKYRSLRMLMNSNCLNEQCRCSSTGRARIHSLTNQMNIFSLR